MNAKILFLFSFLPVGWIAVLAISYYAKFDPVWLGVLRELITIPIILGAFGLLILSFIVWVKERFSIRSFAFYALFLLGVSLTLLFTS